MSRAHGPRRVPRRPSLAPLHDQPARWIVMTAGLVDSRRMQTAACCVRTFGCRMGSPATSRVSRVLASQSAPYRWPRGPKERSVRLLKRGAWQQVSPQPTRCITDSLKASSRGTPLSAIASHSRLLGTRRHPGTRCQASCERIAIEVGCAPSARGATSAVPAAHLATFISCRAVSARIPPYAPFRLRGDPGFVATTATEKLQSH